MTQIDASAGTEPVNSPTCCIIIPTRDKLEFLKPCIESIRQSDTDFSYEIVIVDNDSEQAATRDYLDGLAAEPGVRVLQWMYPFNFSAINNFAAHQTGAEVLCFLNNDIEVTDPQWLNKMLPIARREDVGACGCVLLYPDQSIQHGGIALDHKAIARHIGLNQAQEFFDQNQLNQPLAVDAVTAACLFIRRDLFLLHGGFNENNLAVSFNDVDLCLRLREKGKPILLHPAVRLLHHESVSRMSDHLSPNRPRALREYAYMQQRWRHQLANKRYHSGMPAALLDQLPGQGNLDATVDTAIRALYREQAIELSAPAEPEEQQVADLASRRATSFKELEQRFNALQAHTHRIEEAHRLIESSVFWRMTAPLRLLREWLFSLRGEAAAATQTEPGEDGGQDESKILSLQQDGPLDKQRLDREAQRILDNFLASGERLEFPAADKPLVTIALVFFNRAALSFLCLRSILEQVEEEFELLIVDNNSTDDTATLLSRLDGVVIERNDENLGFVRAVNQAAALARGKYLLLLNNDATLEADAVKWAIQGLQQQEDIGAVGAKIKLLDGTLQEAGSIIWNDGACVGYGRGDDPKAPQYMFQRTVDYCSGAFLLMELALFRELQCFDEQFAPAYYEESDFCIRLQSHGYRVLYEPRARISHYEFASTGGLDNATRLQQEHRELLCEKHQRYLTGKYSNDPDNILAARSANDFPNVLIIDDRVPYPSLGAGYPRCAHILNSLAALPLNLTFYPLLYPEDDWDAVYELLAPGIEVMLGGGRAGLLEFLQERQGFYQTIMVSRVHNMQIFNQVLSQHQDLLGSARLVYDAEAVSAPREVMQRRFWGESLSDEQAHEMVAQELKQAQHANAVIAVSEQEASIYHEHGIQNTVVLGHMLPLQPSPKTFSQRKDLLFVGALRDEGSPNVDSLLWFLVNCLPLIENQVSDIRLIVVGDNTVPSLSTVTKANVIFTGRLESIEQYYEDSRVFIAPTRFAAGIPHKVHEAASKGLPSVTTSLLAQQLNWQDEQELLSADEPEAFASQCVRLYSDEGLWQKIRDAGLVAVERDCSQQAFQQQLEQLFVADNNPAQQ